MDSIPASHHGDSGAFKRSNIYQSLQEIYPQRPDRAHRTPGSESSTRHVFGHDDTHDYLQEIYPHHEYRSSDSHSSIARVLGHDDTHKLFREIHAHRLRPKYKSPLRPVSPEASPTVDPLRSAFRSFPSQRALNQVPLNLQPSTILPVSDVSATAYFQANVASSSRRKDASTLTHGMSSSSSDSEDDEVDSTNDPRTSLYRLHGPDEADKTQDLPLMSSAASDQNWAAAAVRPESDEPPVQAAYYGFKRFVCDICFKTFSQKVHMQTHRHTHTGETPHRCKYNCGESFGDPAKRTRHYKDRESSCFQCRRREE